jgi:hypothetical protein
MIDSEHMTAERRLQILFKKEIHHGFLRNALLSPNPTEQVKDSLQPDERCVVLVKDKMQRGLWFTDRRLLREDASGVLELFSYVAVRRVHWMARENRFQLPKEEYFDRLEIDLETGDAQIDGLDQAYLAVLQFLQWVAKDRVVVG